ncbi:MAG: type I restriction endonuclease subunit R [Methanobrevibacter sp.]|uniref:type I restriction endonuclease subunit R n=1 Tax=Methanobrevibacter sp. TaxID=66852 RepID=UPI003F0951E1
MSFDEYELEQSFKDLFGKNGYDCYHGDEINRNKNNVLIEDDLITYLKRMYDITDSEIKNIIQRLKNISVSSVYDANKEFFSLLTNGFLFKRENIDDKDIFIHLIDFEDRTNNIFKFVNQVEIEGSVKRIPDGIVFINGLPIVVLEFKSAVRGEEATIYDAYEQLTIRYQRDIPELFKYNAFVVISDGVNNKYGTLFTDYEYFYAWKKLKEEDIEKEGINSLYTMMYGLFNKEILLDIIKDFIYFPDVSNHEVKIICRYPQYFSATKVHENVIKHIKPEGDGKGGTVFGATGSGKSYAMLYLTRMLMRDKRLKNPTILLITDRYDLDIQLAEEFLNAKNFIGDNDVIRFDSRKTLKEYLKDRKSGGVYLTTIQKFNESVELLTERSNVICISDEAHRSQLNLDEKQTVDETGVYKTIGFAKCLHESLPNATYVGFTGTPIDATIDVFGEIVSQYTMYEAVDDGIIVNLKYDGRYAKVTVDEELIKLIEQYYKFCESKGTNQHQIQESIKQMTRMYVILGNPNRLEKVANDFIADYEQRVEDRTTVKGKAIFVCSKREIGYEFYKIVINKRPEWAIEGYADDIDFDKVNLDELKKMPKIKMVMTREKDDDPEFYEILGSDKDRAEASKEFKNENSNFKIAIVRDMWLTGFDVPCLDLIYIDKAIQQHTLIQTVSRVNRAYEGKEFGIIIDYIGIKDELDLALRKYNDNADDQFEDIDKAIKIVKDKLSILHNMFYEFDDSDYFNGTPSEKLQCLKEAAEFAQVSEDIENRFMGHVRDLSSAYKLCTSSEEISKEERDYIYFYQGVRSIIYKYNKGDAPDVSQMNRKVGKMLEAAIQSEGVEEVFKIDQSPDALEIFSKQYQDIINKIQLPNTRIKLLERLLKRVITDYKKVNRIKSVEFTERLNKIVDDYNEMRRKHPRALEAYEEITKKISELFEDIEKDRKSFEEMNITIEQKAFYDILKYCAEKYDFEYPHEKLLPLSAKVKELVEEKTKFGDWKNTARKAELEAELIILLDDNGYPPVPEDEVINDVFEQAENYGKYNTPITG